jgi:hypothetical protein
MEDMSLHILDIAENSIEAGATAVKIGIREDTAEDMFVLTVDDNGRGVEEETVEKTLDPFFTSKTGKKCGLGIPLLAQAARECGGDFSITTGKGKGMRVVARFQRSHIDMKPMGDVGATMATLICGHPEVAYSLTYESDGRAFSLGSEELARELDGVPLHMPAVYQYVKDDINEGIRRIKE